MIKQEKLNLLHLTLSMGQGGIENLILDMARHSDKNLYNVIVGCLDEGGLLLEEVHKLGFETFVLSRKMRIDFGLIFQLVKILRNSNIHVLNTHNEAAHFYGCLASIFARTPVVVNTEHSRHYITNHWRRRFEKFILSFFTDKIVEVSKELKTKSIKLDYIPEKKLQVILNGIDIDYFSKDEGKLFQKQLVEELNFDFSGEILGIIGRLHPVKNHQLLLQAFRHLLVQHSDNIYLLVVGDGEERENLVRLSQKLGIENNIFFLGFRKEISGILKLLDVLILCSHTEGLPLTLLEAMCANTPVVVTTGANQSGLVINGKNGFIVNSEPYSLAQGIVKALDKDKINNIVRFAHKFVQCYSIHQTNKCYIELYNDILMKKNITIL